MKKDIVASLIFGGIAGGAAGVTATGARMRKEIEKQKQYADKHLLIMQMFNQWLLNKQEGKSIVKFFEDNGYKSVAIYGLSYLGERLVDDLKDSGIEVKYAIDKNADSIYADIEVKKPTDGLPRVDAVIVTAVYFFDEIEEELDKLVKCPIISLEDVLYEI